MSRAIANLDDLKRLQGSIRKTEETIQQAIRDLNREFERADWRDDRRRDFESKLKEASSNVQRGSQRIQELTPILNKAIADLSRYLGR